MSELYFAHFLKKVHILHKTEPHPLKSCLPKNRQDESNVRIDGLKTDLIRLEKEIDRVRRMPNTARAAIQK